MTWTPSNRHFRSPGSSPETYRRIIRNDEDFPTRTKEQDEEFFNGRRSPTFPRRIFKEVWNDSPTSNHSFSDRPRMFKRVFRPDRWEDEFNSDIPHLRRVEREFDRDFDGEGPKTARKFDEDFEKRFNARDIKKDLEDEFEKSDGRVHHIPIMVEKRIEEIKSRFGKNKCAPPDNDGEEQYSEEWMGPQVQHLKKNFEQPEDRFSSRYSNYRVPGVATNSKPRPFTSPVSETWDPHAIHTLPTRKAHKSSQSFDDSRHPVPPKYVFRSYSETHDDAPRQQQQHSAAFRSHSDGHCPKQTYVTKIEVNLPTQKEKDELCSPGNQSKNDKFNFNHDSTDYEMKEQSPEANEESGPKPKGRNKYDNPSMQQIAVVLQNVEDLVIRVDSYNGAGRDKQYRFLDEMLTRCMLRLDDVDTEGREDIRNARKAAVREVQNCVDMLEAKADESERRLQQKNAKSSQAERNSSDVHSEQKHAIPLGNKTDDSGLQQNKAIPLPAGPTANECNAHQNKAIPVECKTDEPQIHNQAIPLGYTQDDINNQNIRESKLKSKKNTPENELNQTDNGEQTKL